MADNRETMADNSDLPGEDKDDTEKGAKKLVTLSNETEEEKGESEEEVDDSEDFYISDSEPGGLEGLEEPELEYQYEPGICLSSLTTSPCTCVCHQESGELMFI